MGIPSELRNMWVTHRKGLLIASPAEDKKMVRSKRCTSESVLVGFKTASIACVAATVTTLAAVRIIPWAKANLNYTAQALIISAASVASFCIAADKNIMECARKNSLLEEALRQQR